MSLYINEKPEYLKRSLDSILNQTLKSKQIVLVVDGPISDELESIVSDYS